MYVFWRTLAAALSLVLLVTPAGAAEPDWNTALVRNVQIKPGQGKLVLKGRVEGNRYVNYRLRAGAGQQLAARLDTASTSLYFNLLPPGSNVAAMHIGEFDGAELSRVLPDDGTYVLRVFLVRAVARRGARADFTLELALSGDALNPLSPADDALVAGTRFHAKSVAACAPDYSDARQCTAGVIRRGRDGTATVVLGWTANKNSVQRRLLFVKGQVVAADAPRPIGQSRNARGDYIVTIGDNERFEVPEALITGG